MPEKSFRYLKKGEGISRFGKIRYPKFSGKTLNVSKMATKYVEPIYSSADSGRYTGTTNVESVPETISTRHKGILEGLRFSSEVSFLDWQQNQV